ncbi:hypothetical protein ACQ859_16635 [Roseateles chitinivorans]|uniref:hypothetical protein n=1 Tax=Roseateles chitinivorans TaxID=2917965 RepID=UPI003D66F36C
MSRRPEPDNMPDCVRGGMAGSEQSNGRSRGQSTGQPGAPSSGSHIGLPDETGIAPGPGRVRVTLELSRSDDPLLFDALAGLPKGRRRVARLRTLAHDGLLATGPATGPATDPAARSAGLVRKRLSGAAGVSRDAGTSDTVQAAAPAHAADDAPAAADFTKERDTLAWPDAALTAGVFDAPLNE